jgi:hypothetical protein
MVVHVDNAPVHHSKMIQNFFEHSPLKKFPYPLDLPDISPLNFYLFGKIESAPIGQAIPDEIAFLVIVTQILNGISDEELQAVFHSCIEYI